LNNCATELWPLQTAHSSEGKFGIVDRILAANARLKPENSTWRFLIITRFDSGPCWGFPEMLRQTIVSLWMNCC
jgi:hypothetical protein